MPESETAIVLEPRKNARGKATSEYILTEAVRFFAEVGFGGQTRELGKRIGLTHATLYRHYANKDALIEAVYQRVYLDRWDPQWEFLITDRNKPLCTRLETFYVQYANRVFDYEWIRILMYSGLRGNGLPNRYLSIIREKVIHPILRELQTEGSMDRDPASKHVDEELLWALHGGIIYMAIRQHVYGTGQSVDIEATIQRIVQTYLRGLSPDL